MPEEPLPELRLPPREGGYARGQEGAELILRAALALLIEQGYRALTLRRIASECGMKIGNVTYYFKSKADLLRALIEAVVGSYEEMIEEAVRQADNDPSRKLQTLINLLLDDIASKKTTFLFPELWSLANHDPFVRGLVEDLYGRERAFFSNIIREMNPALADGEREAVATLIIGSTEGLTIFAGYGKPMRGAIPLLKSAATRCFGAFVTGLKPGDLELHPSV